MDEIYAASNYEIVGRMGANLKRYRIKAELTQEELAARAGVAVGTIKNFERGTSHNITISCLLRLMRAIGILEQIGGVLPDMSISPFEWEEINRRLEGKRRIRVKHKTSAKQ